MNFNFNPFFSDQVVCSTLPKSQGKNLNILRTERAFEIKQKPFFIIFERLSLEQLKKLFLEGERSTLSTFKDWIFSGMPSSLSIDSKIGNVFREIPLKLKNWS